MLYAGAQLYTVRDFIKTPEDIEASLKKVANIGYKAIQVSGMADIEPERLHEIAMENGLDIVITHVSEDRILNATDRVIEAHKILGCQNIGLGCMHEKYRNGGVEGYRAFIKDFTPVVEKIEAAGMHFNYHNHHFEYARFDDRVMIDLLQEEMPMLRFIPDVYWIQVGGRNPADQIKKMSGRIDVCHLKDLQIEVDKQVMAPVGEGNLDMPAILKACEEAGVKYAMVEQDDTRGIDPFKALEISYHNLEKMGCYAK